jgi:hypothetical protein
VITWPGVAGAEKPYEPFFVLNVHCVVDVGILGDVVMQASVTLAPAESRTVPAIVTDALAVEVAVGRTVGVEVCGGSVRVGVGSAAVGVRVGDGDSDASS